jgi:hypothetical protein
LFEIAPLKAQDACRLFPSQQERPAMKMVAIQQTSGEKIAINPAFITAVWPAGEVDVVTVSISEFPGGSQTQLKAQGSMKFITRRINAALR